MSRALQSDNIHDKAMEDDLRVMSNKIQTPGLGFLIIPFLRDVLDAKNPTAKASSSDVSSIVFEKASDILERYISCMTPLKSSWAGQTAPHSPTGEVLGHSLANVIAEIRDGLPDKYKHLVDTAKLTLFNAIKDALESKLYGLKRTKVHKFSNVVPGHIRQDPYALLDKILSAVEPLEVMIHGPDRILTLEYEGLTNHDLNLDLADLMLWRDQMLDAYALWVTSSQRRTTTANPTAGTGPTLRSSGASTSETPPTNAELTVNERLKAPLLFERRPFIDQLLYMKGSKYSFRAKGSSFDSKDAVNLLRDICSHVEWTREDCRREFDEVFGGEKSPPAIVTTRAPAHRDGGNAKGNQATANAATADDNNPNRSRNNNGSRGNGGKGGGRNRNRSKNDKAATNQPSSE